ncbi:MAG: GAF domain-containing protein, partial [Caldilineae bacterium]
PPYPAHPLSDAPRTADTLRRQEAAVVPATDALAAEIRQRLQTDWREGEVLVIPLVSRRRPIGLVELYARQRPYRPPELELARTLAHQAAIALDNAQLYRQTDEQLKLRLQELSGLQKVIHELNSTLVLDNIIRLVIEEAVRATGADFGNVTLYNPQTGILETRVHTGWPDDIAGEIPTITEETGIMGRALRRKKPEIVDDVTTDPDYIPFPLPSRSEMVVPILYAETVQGVINLESTRPAAFTADQLQYVQALADQAAIAIRNARAFEEQVKERREASRRASQLALLSEVYRAFRANQPLEVILEEVAFAIQEAVGFNVALLSVARDGFFHRVAGAGIPLAEMNRARRHPQPIAAVERLMQPRFRIGDSYFIPAEDKALWQGQLDVMLSDVPPPTAPTAECWQVEDLLFTPLHDSEGRLIG